VRELVVLLLGTGGCSVDRAAQHLGIDRRTIHRRLAREGATFSSIVEAVRCELADRYLREGPRSVAEVATMLGFSAASGFSHWYRKHYQARPSARRKPGGGGRLSARRRAEFAPDHARARGGRLACRASDSNEAASVGASRSKRSRGSSRRRSCR
jgi:AraC-like DNA-binding protein